MKTAWSFLVHGDAGVGKSRLISTLPKPLLLLDAEGRARYLPGKKIEWDPQREKPPEQCDDWDICIVHVQDYAVLDLAYQWVQSGQHCFKSIGIDSLTEAQKRFVDQLVGMEQLQQQDWGAVLRNLESLVRKYRDVALSPANSIECVAFVAGSRANDNGKILPLLQGALRDTLPYHVDSCGYLYVTHENGAINRNLLVQPMPTIVAKDGTDKLGGPIILNPNLTDLYNQLGSNE